MPSSSSIRRFAIATLPLVLAACTGMVDGQSERAAATSGSGSSGSGPSSSTPRPEPGSFAGPIVSEPAPASRFVRLNHAQWENTVQGLLHLAEPLGLSSAFVAEPLRSTFDTNGSVLSVSPDNYRDYQIAAETLSAKLAHDDTLLGAFLPSNGDDSAKVAAFISSFGERVFRRPLTSAEVTRCQTLFDQGSSLIGSGDNFADGVELVATYLLQSPFFLYRSELSSAVTGGKVPLDGYEIASKISYALTNTLPDDALFEAAASGALATAEQVAAQAERLLESSAAARMVANFHDQLLVMRDFDQVSKDAARFPLFGEGASDDLKREAQGLISEVIFAQDRGLAELLTAPYTFANSRIRGMYGLAEGGSPGAFEKLALDPSERAGLLTQIGFLAANAEGTTPNIIIRGVQIAKKLLCVDLPAPPDGVPPLPALSPDDTNRKRVQELTGNVPCSGCHAELINPLGFGLEQLDGVGKFRTEENGQTVDASGSYELDGQSVSFNGAVELAQAMAGSDQAHVCYARHWVEYLYGRSVDPENAADLQLIEQGGWLSHDSESVRKLIVNLLATDAFLTRAP